MVSFMGKVIRWIRSGPNFVFRQIILSHDFWPSKLVFEVFFYLFIYFILSFSKFSCAMVDGLDWSSRGSDFS